MKKSEKSEKISKHSNRCTVTEVYKKKKGYVNPVIVTFQNGELKDDQADLKVVLTLKNDRTGVEVESDFHVFKESNVNQLPQRNHVIAIRNKKTNKIRLVEVDAATLINSALITTPIPNPTASEFDKNIKNLYRTFGGKKAVSQVVRSEKLNFSSMPVTDELKQTITGMDLKVDVDESFNTSEIESITLLLPPCHRDSTKVEDVYNIREILSDRELDSLMEEVKNMDQNKFNPKEYSQFFMDCYAEAKKSDDNIMVRLAGLLFAETLLRFLKIPAKNIASKRTVLCTFSSLISEKLLSEFCIKKESSVTRPQTMKDKCICYIIALCLISCNYQINLQKLQTAIPSVNLSRLLRLAKVVGGIPLSKEGYQYTIKLPLPALPKTQKGRLKKK